MAFASLKIMVTGSSGFIGSHLMDRLIKVGHLVYSLDKSEGTSTSDFSNLEPYLECDVDLIVHLGANCSSQISLRDPSTDFTDNVIGTFNICEFSRLKGSIPIIFNSTMKIYPGEDGIIPPYGLSKRIGEMYLREFGKLYEIPFIINRPSSVYGPRQNGSEDGGWLTWFIRASLSNRHIKLFGDGTQSRDVLYIDDHIDLLLEEIEQFEKFRNEDFDFGGGKDNEIDLNSVLDFLEYSNFSLAPKLAGDVQRFVCDNRKLKSYSDWNPKIGWREGIERTTKYFAMQNDSVLN